jgi:NADPH2:quinone reductase
MVVTKAKNAVPIPDGVSDEVAAGITITYGTALHGLKDRAGLQAGETVAILGAAGGAGLAAVEIAKLMGARVIAVASSGDKLAFAREHGADEGITTRPRTSRRGSNSSPSRRGSTCSTIRSAAPMPSLA